MSLEPHSTAGDDASPDPIDVEPAEVTATPVEPPDSDEVRTQKLTRAREQILQSLRDRATLQPPLAWALLVGGATLLLVIGVVLAVLLWLIASIVVGDSLAVRTWLLIYLIALIPVLILAERRGRNGFFTFASTDVDLTRDEDEYLLERGASTARSVVDALLWPIRATVAGFHGLKRTPSKGLDMILPEAADTLTLMLTLDGGVKIKDLAPPGTDPAHLMPVLTWLDTHDYIGISTKGDRVWVSSPAKKRFTEQGIRVPKVELPS